MINHKKWTPERVAAAEDMIANGTPFRYVAKTMGVTVGALRGAIAAHGAPRPSDHQGRVSPSTDASRQVDAHLKALHDNRAGPGIRARAMQFADRACGVAPDMRLARTYAFVAELWRVHGPKSLADTDVSDAERFNDTIDHGDGGRLIWSRDPSSMPPQSSVLG